MKRVVSLLLFAAAAFAQTPTITAVVNGADYQTALCPGLYVAIFGSNFGTVASAVTITVGGKLGYTVAATASQIVAELPVDAPTGATTLTVTVGGNASAPFNITLATYAPAFFTQNQSGEGTGTFLTATNTPVTPAAPAQPGEALVAYLAGLGATNPVTPTGPAGAGLDRTVTTPILMVGSATATIVFAGAAPDQVGVYQINFVVPAGVSGIEPVTVSIAGVSSPIPVTLPIVGASPRAIGSIDTPVNDTSGITGAVSVTGWGLSWAGVQSIALWRAPVGSEARSANGLVFVGNVAIVPGSRPDVAAIYPGYPGNNSGFGAQILTNELPNTTGTAGVGNGTWEIHVIVTDTGGEATDIGTRTFSADNANAVLPFGTIDTPATGATVSGAAYVNFGWALTPQPNMIPTDGSTINVFVDNKPMGHPVYNNPRADIEALFPGYVNTNGAVGYLRIDTTKLTNGLHSISWAVKDSAGNKNGLGSRFFVVTNAN